MRHSRQSEQLQLPPNNEEQVMGLHKRILEWQAEHPTITWIGWGIVWTIVLIALFWPRTAH